MKILIGIVVLLLAACSTSSKQETETIENPLSENTNELILTIKHGSNFGNCMGYCFNEYSATSKSFAQSKRAFGRGDRSKFPNIDSNKPLTQAQYNELLNQLDTAKFYELDTVIGCPDCADGGSEWISIESKGKSRKVTFEYGKTPKILSKLVSNIKQLESTFFPLKEE